MRLSIRLVSASMLVLGIVAVPHPVKQPHWSDYGWTEIVPSVVTKTVFRDCTTATHITAPSFPNSALLSSSLSQADPSLSYFPTSAPSTLTHATTYPGSSFPSLPVTSSASQFLATLSNTTRSYTTSSSIPSQPSAQTKTQRSSSAVASSSAVTSSSPPTSTEVGFVHPGLLQSSADFNRIKTKIAAGSQPWAAGYQKLLKSEYATPAYQPNPAPSIYRGSDGIHAENYAQLYIDVGAAYVLSLLWAITGESQWGDAAVRVLDAWSSTLVALGGDTDVYLAAGIYGYEFSQSAEIMRDYSAWTGFSKFQDMVMTVFYPVINGWFIGHENWGSYASSVYPGWDLCIIAGGMSIGILTDNKTIYNQAIDWFYNGTGNGQINRAIPFVYSQDNELLAQPMEAGRDQGHTMLDIALLGVIGQTSWNQGLNLFGYNGSLIRSA